MPHLPAPALTSLTAAVRPLLRLPPADPTSPANARFSEVCACCQGVPDVDEAVGPASVALGGSHPAHQHGHASVLGTSPDRLGPSTLAERAWQHVRALPRPTKLQGVTAYFSAIGLYFGNQNYRQAGVALQHLAPIADHTAQRRALLACLRDGDATGAQPPTAPQGHALSASDAHFVQWLRTACQRAAAPDVPGDAVDRVYIDAGENLRAYADTVAHSQSMQRFIRDFAGIGAMANAAGTLAGTVVHAMEPIGVGLLAGYCLSHVVRYAVWERPRLNAAATAVPCIAAARSVAAAGEAHVQQTGRDRLALFGWASALFGVYAFGSTAMVVLFFAPSTALLGVGASTLLVGSMATTYLNNAPIKETFGKTCDWGVDREQQGSLGDLYLQLGRLRGQLQALTQFDAKLQQFAPAFGERWRRRAWLLGDALARTAAQLLATAGARRGEALAQHWSQQFAAKLEELPPIALHPIWLGASERWRRRGDVLAEGVLMAAAFISFGLTAGYLQRFQHQSRHRALRAAQPFAEPAVRELAESLRALDDAFRAELAEHGSATAQARVAWYDQHAEREHQLALAALLSGHDEDCGDACDHAHDASAGPAPGPHAGHAHCDHGDADAAPPATHGLHHHGHAHHDHPLTLAPPPEASEAAVPSELSGDDQLVLLHAASFKYSARLHYELGALTDHAIARLRLRNNAT